MEFKETAEIKCPHCEQVQSEDLYDLAMDGGEMEGDFPVHCENCEKQFTVFFKLKANVSIHK